MNIRILDLRAYCKYGKKMIYFILLITLSCAKPCLEKDKVHISRQLKNSIFKNDKESPLSEIEKENFTELNYFKYNCDFEIPAIYEEFDIKDTISMLTTKGLYKKFIKTAKLKFKFNNIEKELIIFKATFYESHEFFLPFTDESNSNETYPTGRYMEIKADSLGKWLINFNKAYNPYCNYSDNYNCPIPQGFNKLDFRVEAGEKKYISLTHE